MLKKPLPLALYITIWTLLTTPSDLLAFQALPDLFGWERLRSENREITSSKGIQGLWQEAEFGKGSQRIKVFLLSGPAFGYPMEESREFQSSDGPLGNGSLYRRFSVLGHSAVMETTPFVGTALSVRVSKDMELIVEAGESLSMDVIDLAKVITRELTSQ